MNHLLLGAIIPFGIGFVIYLAGKCRASMSMLVIIPVLMSVSMLWAVAPDMPRLLGMNDLYYQLTRDPRCDIFYWHYSIDLVESESPWCLVGFMVMSYAMLYVAWRELFLLEKESQS